MSGSTELLPRIKLNVSQVGRPMVREGIPRFHSLAPGQRDPDPERQRSGAQGETEGVSETKTEVRSGREKEAAQRVGEGGQGSGE